MNLYDTIVFEMETDDQSSENISAKLIARYKNSTEKEQDAIDDFLITLVGYSFKTLQERKEGL
jgi:hypothetical protein